MTAKWLPNVFRGTSLYDLVLGVSIAPGADLTASSGSWSFTDITTDVMGRIEIAIGRGDEQSEAQTATCTFTALNDSGDYTPRKAGSRYYPNMRLGFPVKVWANSTVTGTRQFFTGYVDEIAPSWDESQKVPTVQFSCKGTIQRLQQGTSALAGTMSLDALDPAQISHVAAYWPMTDGVASTRFASGVSGGLPLTISGTMDFAAYSGFTSSEPVAEFTSGANISGAVNNTLADTSGAVYFRCLLFFGGALADQQAMIRLSTTGTIKYWYLRYRTGGGLSLSGSVTDGGASVFDTGPIAFSVGVDNLIFQLGIELVQSGGNVAVKFYTVHIESDRLTHTSTWTDTATSQTVGQCVGFSAGGNGTMTGWAMGQVGVANSVNWLPVNGDVYSGYAQETPTDRIQRICDLFEIPVTIDGTSDVPMDTQGFGSVIDALTQAEASDHGFLYDGVGFGLAYIARSARHNASVDMALDIRLGHVMPPFQPLENTRLVRNDITVSRNGGASARATQPTGSPYSVSSVGAFTDSKTLSLFYDEDVSTHATWLLHLGTVDTDRFSNLSMDLSATPTLAASWLANFVVGARVTVTGLPSTGGTDPDLFVEGMTLTLSPYDWSVSANCSPATVYDVAKVNTDRVQTNGSTLASSAAQGARSISVSVNSLWSTSAGTFDLNVGGYKVSCTAISGSSSPQTFTITSLPGAVASGAPVSVWRPAIVALEAGI